MASASLHFYLRYYEVVFERPPAYALLAIAASYLASKVCEVPVPIDHLVRLISDRWSEMPGGTELYGLPALPIGLAQLTSLIVHQEVRLCNVLDRNFSLPIVAHVAGLLTRVIPSDEVERMHSQHSPIDFLRALREDQYDATLLDDVLRPFFGLPKQHLVICDTAIGCLGMHLVPMYHITDARDSQGRTIAHFAAAGMKLAMLCRSGFLRMLKPYFLSIDHQGRTPIHDAMNSGRMDDVTLMLAQGVGTDHLTEGDHRRSLLDVALEQDQLAIAHSLLELAVNWPIISSSVLFALAASPVIHDRSTLHQIVTELLARGFDPSVSNEEGKDLLLVAAGCNQDFMWDMLRRNPELLSNRTPSNPMLVAVKR
jgi:hypothetical protein